MIPKIDDSVTQWISYCWVVIIAAWGGIVSYFHKIDKHKIPFNLIKFIAEIATSAFVGVITFLLCDAANLSWELTAAFVGVSGHMGTRALFIIEKKYEKFVKGDLNDNS